MLQVDKYKSGIKIKKSNRGKFTSYCGGEVTSACILKGKHSSNPAIRKRATFAANARKWKHLFGGTFTVPLDNTRVVLLPRPSRIVRKEPVRLQAEFKPWTYADLQASNRRKEEARQALVYRNTYHTWLIDPTRPYPKTDLEMISAFNYANRSAAPIRAGLTVAGGAMAGKQLVGVGKEVAQSFATPLGRALWGNAVKDMAQFWKPSSSAMVNIGKTYIVGDEIVAPTIDKGLDIYYKSQEPSLNMLYNGILTNLRVMEAINNGDEGLREIFTDQ